MNRLSYWLPGLALLAAVVAALIYWWPRAPRPQLPASDIPAAAVTPAAPPPVAATPSEPAIKHPIEAASAAPLPQTDQITVALNELLGAKAVHAFVQTDSFAQRLVITVDNLGRPFAASRLWPVNPAPGRFEVAAEGDPHTIAPRNAERYDAFVRFVDGVDPARAVATYKKLYPQFQRAYEEQGYPGRYFNDRVVEVIDQLLATPEPDGPLAVRLTEVKGPLASKQTWRRYEYGKPEYESLSSGQKMLLRMGPAHERRLKAKLRELRQRLAGP
ncbi:MAG: DUF3014 domain-containing protein [Betaproteobacteria bacterium]